MKKIFLASALVLAASAAQADRQINALNAHLRSELANCNALTYVDYFSGHEKCVNTKNEELQKFKGFIKINNVSPKVKAMFAQWMTAMDTAGRPEGSAEEGKFKTLSAEVELE